MQKYNKPQQPTGGASSCYATMQQPPATMHHAAATGNSIMEHSFPLTACLTAWRANTRVRQRGAQRPRERHVAYGAAWHVAYKMNARVREQWAVVRCTAVYCAVRVACCAKRMGAESRLGLAATKARSHYARSQLRPLPRSGADLIHARHEREDGGIADNRHSCNTCRCAQPLERAAQGDARVYRIG